jgi:hypothetical protein
MTSTTISSWAPTRCRSRRFTKLPPARFAATSIVVSPANAGLQEKQGALQHLGPRFRGENKS